MFYIMTLSLKRILKKYILQFVDSYYRFYEMCETEKFGINASDVIKYLGLTPHKKFYKRLRIDYEINKDYIIKRIKQNQ